MTQSSHRHPLKGTGIRLHPYHYWVALAVLLAVAVSGLVWTILHDLLQWEDAPVVRQLLQLHGAFAFCSLILFGSMLPQHIRFAWVARRNRVTGTLTGIVFLLLIITAYGLYYGPEDWSGLAKTAHLVVGIAAVAAVPLHMLIGRKRHESYRASASKSARH